MPTTTDCSCEMCRNIHAGNHGVRPEDMEYVEGHWLVRARMIPATEETFAIGGEEVEEMPPRPRVRSVAEIVAEDIRNRRQPEEELSTTQAGELRFPFLEIGLREKVVVITDMTDGHSYNRYREQFIGRPFYGSDMYEELNGYYALCIRCMIRREEIATGIRGIEGARSISINGVKITQHTVEERTRLYETYLRRTRPGYQEVGADFDWSISNPDDESKMERRKVKEQLSKFQGWWVEELHKGKVKFRECVFLAARTQKMEAGHIITVIHLVNYNGQYIEGTNLVQFTGDSQGDLGHLSRLGGINPDLCPFRLNSDGTIYMRNA